MSETWKTNPGGRPLRQRTDPGVQALIAAAGSISGVARTLGVTPGAVSHWDRVPKRYADRLAKHYSVPVTTLRPIAADPSPVR